MPTYEYKCGSCKKIFEEHQSIHDKPLTKCAECGGELKKIFSPAGIIFKGSGFYATDNAKKKTAGPGKKEEAKKNVPAKASPAATGKS